MSVACCCVICQSAGSAEAFHIGRRSPTRSLMMTVAIIPQRSGQDNAVASAAKNRL